MKTCKEIWAIATEYRGTQLKSRLEAQCAFFLDLMGLDWHYEAFSWMLPCGIAYIPDFWIPELHMIVECRGYSNDRGQRQLKDFADHLGDFSVQRFLQIGPQACWHHAECAGKVPAVFGCCRHGLWWPNEAKTYPNNRCLCVIPELIFAGALSLKDGKILFNGSGLESLVSGSVTTESCL